MAGGDGIYDTHEPGFAPTVVGLDGQAASTARASGVLVGAPFYMDAVIDQLLDSGPGFESGTAEFPSG